MSRSPPHCCASGRSPLFEEVKTMAKTIATPKRLVLGGELALEYV